MPQRVAVIGAGVAGLSAAYELRDDFDVTLFEGGQLAGGHANTVHVEENGRSLGLDTGFIVFNEANYPRLGAFFNSLDVPVLDHKGGFLFFDLDGSLRYSTEDLDIPEDVLQAEHSEEFRTISREAKRFYTQAPKHFVRGQADIPLGEYLDREGYSEDFKYGFIILQGSAVWSAPAEAIWDIPASTVIGYFWSHGHGGLGGRNVAWNTVEGGSRTYVNKVLDKLASAGVKINLGVPVTKAEAAQGHVAVHFDGGAEHFDYAVIATHADTAAEIAGGITAEQRAMLKTVRYNTTKVVLHTDTSILPAEREKWRSWNYGRVGRGEDLKAYVVYYLNEIQQFRAEKDYLLSLDCPLQLDEDEVIATFDYTHPIVDLGVRRLQQTIHSINEVNRIKFCGSYFHCRKMGRDSLGSHESAFDSGVAAGGSVRRAAVKNSAQQ
jgi:predicted NAD/FAD-binding protein